MGVLLPVPVERSLAIKPKMFGLEMTDLFIIGAIFGIAFSFSGDLFLNFAIVGAAYAGLRLFKFNKPPNYTTNLFYYLGNRTPYKLVEKDEDYINIKSGVKTVKKAQTQGKYKSFYNKINIWSIEDACIVGLNEDYTAGFKVGGPNIFIMTEEEAYDVIKGVRGMLNNFTEKVKAQIIYKVKDGNEDTIRQYKNTIKPETDLERIIFEDKIKTLEKQKIRKVEIFLFITLKKTSIKERLSLSVNFNKYRSEAEKERQESLTELNIVLNRVKEYFESIKLSWERLEDEDLTEYVYDHLNPSRINFADKPKAFNTDMTAREQLAFSPGLPSWSYFFIDGFYYAGVVMKVPPESSKYEELKELMDMPFAYELMMSIDAPVLENEINRLKRKVRSTELLLKTSGSKNYEAQQKWEEQDQLLKDLQSSVQRLFNVSITILVRDKVYSNLAGKVEKAVQAFTKMSNAQAIKYDSNHELLYLSFLPGHGGLNKLTFMFKTDALANWLPFWANWKGTGNAQMLLKSDNDDLIKLDFDDTSVNAKHKTIVGATGKGKSFLVLFLLVNFLISNLENELLTIDVGPDYKFLNEVFDGSYFQVDLEKDSLNLFPIKKEITRGDGYDPDTISFLASIVELMVSEKGDELTKNELSVIEKCIMYAYDETDDDDCPILSNVETHMFEYKGRDDDDARQSRIMAKAMHYWTSGMYSKILNRKGGLNINNRVVSFDLSLLKAHPKLRDIVYFTINFMVLRKMQNKKGGRYQIVQDEFHEFGLNPIAAKMTADLYRIGRKYNLDITTVSQSPKDFIKHPAADAIMNNAYIKFFLQVNDGIEVLEDFRLSYKEAEIVSNLKSRPGYYSQVFLKYDQTPAVLKVEPGSVDYWICTNNKNDNTLKEEMRKEYKGILPAELLVRLAHKYPKGHFTLKEA